MDGRVLYKQVQDLYWTEVNLKFITYGSMRYKKDFLLLDVFLLIEDLKYFVTKDSVNREVTLYL